MRVIIAGGGTGGHLFPGIAVAEELRARGGHELLFVGTAKGIEARVVPKEGFALQLVDVGGLKGPGPLGLLRGLLRLPKSLLQSLALVRRFRPDLVLGVGGYASGPVVLAAVLGGRPTAILEQNSVPGITNRILGRLVTAVYGAFVESQPFFPAGKLHLLGNPIRARFRAALAAGDQDAASQQSLAATETGNDAASQQDRPRAAAGLAAAGPPKRLLVCGGSQGAHAVNLLVVEAMKLLHGEGRAPALCHQTGVQDRPAIEAAYGAAGIAAEVRDFIDDMARAYGDADLVVGRAGATTLAELCAIGRPAILIPFPFAADDHQTVNARSLERRGAAVVLPQGELTPRRLADEIARLLGDPEARQRMAAASRAAGRPESTAAIVDRLLELGGGAR